MSSWSSARTAHARLKIARSVAASVAILLPLTPCLGTSVANFGVPSSHAPSLQSCNGTLERRAHTGPAEPQGSVEFHLPRAHALVPCPLN
eukprot:scaffold54495_cov58-Phaeocystis_antarctica.AAC.2